MNLLGYELNKFEKKTPTQLIAEAFANNALKAIDSQIGKEVARCGFCIEKLRSGAIILERRQQVQQTPAGEVVIENYKINDVVILAVRWSRNGFTIEVNSESVIKNIIRVNSGFKKLVILGDSPNLDLTSRMSQRDILIEQRTQEILKEYKDEKFKNA